MKKNESILLRNFLDSKSGAKDSNYIADAKVIDTKEADAKKEDTKLEGAKDANYITDAKTADAKNYMPPSDAKSYKFITDARYEEPSSSERASAVNPLNREKKRSAKNIVSRILEEKLSTKASIHQDSVEIKTHGRTAGNIYTRDDGTQYILKTAEMHPTNGESKSNKNQLLYEYMSIAEYLLYNRAPVIGLATDAEFDTNLRKYKDPNQLFLKSEFIAGFVPLSNFVRIKLNISNDIENSNPEEHELLIGISAGKLKWKVKDTETVDVNEFSDVFLKYFGSYKNLYDAVKRNTPLKSFSREMISVLSIQAYKDFGSLRAAEFNEIIGFEKILAVCMFVGDWDFHRENLGVVSRNDQKMMVKVDFGLANSFYTNEQQLREKLYSRLKDFGLGHLNVNAEKLKEAVDQIINIDDREIERIIKHRAYNLKYLGYVLDDNVIASYNKRRVALSPFNDKGVNEVDCRYKELEYRYIDIYKNQKAVFKELSRSLDTIIRIVEPRKWLDNEWLYEIENSIDPEFWAITNQRRIYPPAPEKTDDKEASAEQLMRWRARLNGAKGCLENRIDRSGVDIVDKISQWRDKRVGINAVEDNIKQKISGWYIERDPRIISRNQVNIQPNNIESKWQDRYRSNADNNAALARNKVSSMMQKLRTPDSAPVNKEYGVS